MAELEHWQMWRKRCALARCTASVSQDLQGFAFSRFQRYLQKIGQSHAVPKAPDAWHAFESHLVLGRSRPSKAWKEWLFARGGEPPTLDRIQGGATLIMRDVVREHLRREHAPGWIRSLDAPIASDTGSDTTSPSRGDLLPDSHDPIAAIEEQELQVLATTIFPHVANLLSPRQRIALITHHKGKALSHPSVMRAAQCGKSSLCNALHQALQRLAQLLQDGLPQETAATRITIASLLIEKITANLLKSLETQHADLFKYITEEIEYDC